MIKINHFVKVVVLIVLPFVVYAGSEMTKVVKIDNSFVKLESDDTALTETKLKPCIDIVGKIETGVYKITGKPIKSKSLTGTDSIIVSRDDIQKHLEKQKRNIVMAFNNKKTGVRRITFDSHNYPYMIDFPHDLSKSPKDEYLRKLRKAGANISEYPVIPKSTAVKYAVAFLELLNGIEATAMYDSIRVNEYAEANINMQYIVVFEAKVKNGICDAQGAEVWINAFTGEFVGYRGRPPSLNKEDFNYTPKISKEQALAMFAQMCKKMKGEIKNIDMLLHKEDHDTTRWHWRINASNVQGDYLRPAIQYIDSETGEVIYNTVYK